MQEVIGALKKELNNYNLEIDPFFVNRALNLFENIKREYRGGRILDIGSYPFYILWMLKKLKYDITALDLGPPYDKKVQNFFNKNKISFLKCNILNESFPSKSESFSMAILTEVIEHLSNPLNVLLESNRVLKKSGILILSTPNLHAIGKIFKYLSGIGFEKEIYKVYEQELVKGYPSHIREFSYYEVKTLLKRAGFKIKKVYFEYFSMPKKNKIVIPFIYCFLFSGLFRL